MAEYYNDGVPFEIHAGDKITFSHTIWTHDHRDTHYTEWDWNAPGGYYQVTAYGASSYAYGGKISGYIQLPQKRETFHFNLRDGQGGGGDGSGHDGSYGGGAAAMYRAPNTYADRIIVAGGSGGASGGAYYVDGGQSGGKAGGAGGGYTGSDAGTYGGKGGTRTAGGKGYGGSDGQFGKGGNGGSSGNYGGGGGGGGWYGGGGGNSSWQGEQTGGGGGSSMAWSSGNKQYYPSSTKLTSDYYMTNVSTSTGANSGRGYIEVKVISITVFPDTPNPPQKVEWNQPDRTKSTVHITWEKDPSGEDFQTDNTADVYILQFTDTVTQDNFTVEVEGYEADVEIPETYRNYNLVMYGRNSIGTSVASGNYVISTIAPVNQVSKIYPEIRSLYARIGWDDVKNVVEYICTLYTKDGEKVAEDDINYTFEPRRYSEFSGLAPDTEYYAEIICKDATQTGAPVRVTFKTLPAMELVYDRTEADVTRIKEMNKKGFTSLTNEEKTFWLFGALTDRKITVDFYTEAKTIDRTEYISLYDYVIRGAYNTHDLNRVGEAVNYLIDLTKYYGYNLGIEKINDNYKKSDVFTEEEAAHRIEIIKTIRGMLPLYEDTPETPSSMKAEVFKHDEANAIEKILTDYHSRLLSTQDNAYYSNEIQGGEV